MLNIVKRYRKTPYLRSNPFQMKPITLYGNIIKENFLKSSPGVSEIIGQNFFSRKIHEQIRVGNSNIVLSNFIFIIEFQELKQETLINKVILQNDKSLIVDAYALYNKIIAVCLG